jgi:hypothetical protein
MVDLRLSQEAMPDLAIIALIFVVKVKPISSLLSENYACPCVKLLV